MSVASFSIRQSCLLRWRPIKGLAVMMTVFIPAWMKGDGFIAFGVLLSLVGLDGALEEQTCLQTKLKLLKAHMMLDELLPMSQVEEGSVVPATCKK